MRIAYLRSIFPLVSNTFIMEEAASLAALGHDVRIFADHAGLDVVHAKVHEARLFDRIRYVDRALDWSERASLGARLVAKLVARRGSAGRFVQRLPSAPWSALWRAGLSPGEVRALPDRVLRLGNVSLALGQASFQREAWVPDVIHVPFLYEWEARCAERLQARHPVPLVVALRAAELYLRPRSDPFRGKRLETLAKADRIVTIARSNARHIATDPAYEGVPAREDVAVVHSAIDTSFFAPVPGIARRPRQIACVARLAGIKGLFDLIIACRLLVERGHDVRCVIIGDGPLRPALEGLVANARLGERVTFAGVRDQAGVRELLARSEVFALPCRVQHNGSRDVLPNSLKEAMAMELPVVTSAMSGIDELVHDGVDGLLAPPEEPGLLADRIETLFRDSALRERLGRAARQTIERDFDTRTEAVKLAAVLAETAARFHPGLSRRG